MLRLSFLLNQKQFTAFQKQLPQTCTRVGECGHWSKTDNGEFDIVVPVPRDDEELFFTFAAQNNIIYCAI